MKGSLAQAWSKAPAPKKGCSRPEEKSVTSLEQGACLTIWLRVLSCAVWVGLAGAPEGSGFPGFCSSMLPSSCSCLLLIQAVVCLRGQLSMLVSQAPTGMLAKPTAHAHPVHAAE
eukprot:scaffold254537_cov18-Tisochrysis_lutea.AAC.1